MNYKEKLFNQKIILNKENTILGIVEVSDANNIGELKVTLSNNKTYLLLVALPNGALMFVDNDIQNQLLDEISKYNLRQIELEQQNKEAKRLAAIEAWKKEEAEKLSKKKIIRKDRKNVAYKATYCDGGGHWFKAPCSVACRNANCSKFGGGRFCSTNSVCRKVIDKLATVEEIYGAFNNNMLCYESRILLDFKIYAGRDDDGSLRGWSLDNDRLVILTTVKPGQSEKDRVIFGAFLINHSYDKDDEEACATSYPDCRLSLTEEESECMKYWDYAPGEGDNNLIQWKEGLLRYQADLMCATVLKDLVKIVEKRNNPQETQNAKQFLNKFLEIIKIPEDKIPEKSGARIHN